jgi:hypothetical protein
MSQTKQRVQEGRRASRLRLWQVLKARLYLWLRQMAWAARLLASLATEATEASGCADLGDHAHDEAFLLDAVRLDCVRILKNLA